jgi:CDP-glucose 4,6-dehydratase
MAHKSTLEKMVTLAELKKAYAGKRVFLTGHTGFKGTWMLQILARLGAIVKGYSLAPEHSYDLYNLIDGDSLCHSSVINDIRDAERLRKEILYFEPDYIFHLAAQPLVLKGYEQPLYTFEVNTQGTANLLEAIRMLDKNCVNVLITTDKVYENKDNGTAFNENDKLGGYDPYSASKAACEIIISSYRSSFFNSEKKNLFIKPIASVRAGNVIGGGDFADNRIIPDIIRAIQRDEVIELRNPSATRPWQHVLEPLGVYLMLGAQLATSPYSYDTSYNIGPEDGDVLTVEDLTKMAIQLAGKGSYTVIDNPSKLHEAASLSLDIQKIKHELGWSPVYNSREAVAKTITWYLDTAHADIKCQTQINEYFKGSIDNADDE